ncbi:hypothetical protein [Vibrio agarivorans]|uniref:hypothetical protein n=1 Tax=Vibrio agarivorans TaxID=153622 RepID=UPI0025B3CED5|nr:hypothetical protein [Vibrio agarivorans]MDN3661058.1 hypothetical protein [Vibrio agarivorans]
MDTLGFNGQSTSELFFALIPILKHRHSVVGFSTIANAVSLKNLFDLVSDPNIPEQKKGSLSAYLLSLDSVDKELLNHSNGYLALSESAYDQHIYNAKGILATAMEIIDFE